MISIFGELKSQSQFFFESFEDWNYTMNIWSPIDWEVSPEIDSTLLNVERSIYLNDGEYSVRIRSNIPFFEGNLNQHMTKELPFWSNMVRLKLTYKCKGEGTCRVSLGQSTINGNGTNPRVIWQTEAGDSLTYSVSIDSFEINPPFDVFKKITLSARPIDTGTGQWGICDFTIDSLLVEDLNQTSSLIKFDLKKDVSVFPNPTKSSIAIKSLRNLSFDVIIYDSLGNSIAKYNGVNEIDMNNYPSGMYFLQFKYLNKTVVKKIILKK